jgi:hypothetical protein
VEVVYKKLVELHPKRYFIESINLHHTHVHSLLQRRKMPERISFPKGWTIDIVSKSGIIDTATER